MPRNSNPLSRLEERFADPNAKRGGAYREREQLLREEGSVGDRVVRPLLDRLGGALGGGSSGGGGSGENIEELLMRAGNPGGITARQFKGLQFFAALGLPLIGLPFLFGLVTITGMSQYTPLEIYIALGAVMMGFGFIVPKFILRILIGKRRKAIVKQLPDVLDLITIAVEAGMGFDAAMDRVTLRFKGALSDEMQRSVNEIRMGRPWNDAMRGLYERCEEDGLRSLIMALIQAKELGVNLGNVLRAQAQKLREERARKAREQAQKAPTKMMVPLVLFIFPTLFIVLMGPAVLRAFRELASANLPGFS